MNSEVEAMAQGLGPEASFYLPELGEDDWDEAPVVDWLNAVVVRYKPTTIAD